MLAEIAGGAPAADPRAIGRAEDLNEKPFESGGRSRIFPAEPESVRSAREFVRGAIADSQNAADAVLLVSELATNAIIHAKSSFAIDVKLQANIVRVEVVDESPILPVLADTPPLGSRGRGLGIVNTLARAWGTEARGQGKAIWFEIER
jgi:anti-sigma regulatory factor (Ser/Thr protein kinase)